MRKFTTGERLGLAIIIPVLIVGPLDMLRRLIFGDGSRIVGILMASVVVMAAWRWALTAEGPDDRELPSDGADRTRARNERR